MAAADSLRLSEPPLVSRRSSALQPPRAASSPVSVISRLEPAPRGASTPPADDAAAFGLGGAAPDAVVLAVLERVLEAAGLHRAGGADRLGPLDPDRLVLLAPARRRPPTRPRPHRPAPGRPRRGRRRGRRATRRGRGRRRRGARRGPADPTICSPIRSTTRSRSRRANHPMGRSGGSSARPAPNATAPRAVRDRRTGPERRASGQQAASDLLLAGATTPAPSAPRRACPGGRRRRAPLTLRARVGPDHRRRHQRPARRPGRTGRHARTRSATAACRWRRRSRGWSSSTPEHWPTPPSTSPPRSWPARAGDGNVEAVGVTNQRASTILWDAADGRSLGPGLGWQDLRTAGDCLALQADGLRLAPNQSATKLAHLLAQPAAAEVPVERLRFGTVDTWLAWHLTGGTRHVTDLSNAAVTGLVLPDGSDWDDAVLERLGIPRSALPDDRRVGRHLGEVTALGGSGGRWRAADASGPLALTGVLGDQQASLVGQGGTRPGVAKITFGTGGMLDVFLGEDPPASATRQPHGTFPIVVLRAGGVHSWGAEGHPAGRRLQRGLAARRPGHPHRRGRVGRPGGPGARHGRGRVRAAPARGGHARLGPRRPWHAASASPAGTDRRHLCRAVLEGVADAGVDLVEAAEADTGVALPRSGSTAACPPTPCSSRRWPTASGRPVEVSPVLEATAVGAGLVAGLGLGWYRTLEEVAAQWRPARVVEPTWSDDRRAEHRARWQAARERAAGLVPRAHRPRLLTRLSAARSSPVGGPIGQRHAVARLGSAARR